MFIIIRVGKISFANNNFPLLISFLFHFLGLQQLLLNLSISIGHLLVVILLIILQLLLQNLIIITMYILTISNKIVLLTLASNLQCPTTFILSMLNVLKPRIYFGLYFVRYREYKPFDELWMFLVGIESIVGGYSFMLLLLLLGFVMFIYHFCHFDTLHTPHSHLFIP